MQKEINKINKCLMNNELPKELNFTIQNSEAIDWAKVRYNTFYKTYEFAESKFPPGYDSIPGFDKVIEDCIPTLSPLEEYMIRNQLQSIEELDKVDDDDIDKMIDQLIEDAITENNSLKDMINSLNEICLE